MTTVLQQNDNAKHPLLYMALEFANKTWKVGFHNTAKCRSKTIDAGDLVALEQELRLAKEKLNASADCTIKCCYEAGRDGFWIHRALKARGVDNLVVDSASIEVSRKKKRVKTDRIDLEALLRLGIRYHSGDKTAFSVVRVPTVEEEDARRLHRDRQRLVKERGGHSARIKSLLILAGIRIDSMSELESMTRFTSPAGYNLGPFTTEEIRREYDRYKVVSEQVKAVEKEQAEQVKSACGKAARQLRQLMQL